MDKVRDDTGGETIRLGCSPALRHSWPRLRRSVEAPTSRARRYNNRMEKTDRSGHAEGTPALVAPEIREASELLKVVGDLTRMRLLCALREGELSVGGLQDALGMSQSAVSHQLRVLRDARLVGFERVGKTVRYSLADDHVRDLLRVVLEHARHD